MMTRKGEKQINERARQKLAITIRHHASSPATRGLLLSMPAFRITKEIPQQLQNLLDRLEKSELQANDGQQY